MFKGDREGFLIPSHQLYKDEPVLPRRFLLIALILACFAASAPTLAHANLLQSDPPANAVLSAPPAEIRLWFSEPLEPSFSAITLRDSAGHAIETPPAQVDPQDNHQLKLALKELPEGLYTISWRVVSMADGHQTQGSIPFSIGVGLGAGGLLEATEAPISVDGALIRWLNILGLSAGLGGVGFLLLVWMPSAPTGHDRIEKRLRAVIWLGWGVMGLGALALLLLHTAQFGGTTLWGAVTSPALEQIFNTRFGSLWLARLILWVALAQLLLWARTYPPVYTLALLVGMGILATQSLFSHASAQPLPAIGVANHFIHLMAAIVWLGGLIAFLVTLYSVRRYITHPTPLVAQLVGRFSNLGRVCVALLAVSGFYSAWLQVGSWDALLTTRYGQVLIIKTLLIIPLVAIAGYNLIFTSRGLARGDALWIVRLRAAISAEIALLIGVMMSVGALTSAQPARGVIEARALASQQRIASSYFDSVFENDFHTDFEIIPGVVGDNTFRLTLYGHEGEPIEDASRIRLRFDYLDADLGTSELRAEHVGGGIYSAQGANISALGAWRVRVTIQRPGQFDTVLDFTPTFSPSANTAPPPMPSPLVGATLALLLTGLGLLSIGGYMIALKGLRWGGVGLCVFSFFFLWSGLDLSATNAVSAEMKTDLPPSAPVRLRFAPGGEYPYVITADGGVYQPDDGRWRRLDVQAVVRDVYIGADGLIWAATDTGLRHWNGEAWQTLDTTPILQLEMTHGYIFALGNGVIPRIARGIHDEKFMLKAPNPTQPTRDLVMLGNHTHVLQNGDALFLTPDLGLGWRPLDAPAPVQNIAVDEEGHLIAVTEGGFYIQRYDRLGEWLGPYPLPTDASISQLLAYKAKLYALADGKLYQRAGGAWQLIPLGDAEQRLMALQSQYISASEGRLWAADPHSGKLWWSADGEVWQSLVFQS